MYLILLIHHIEYLNQFMMEKEFNPIMDIEDIGVKRDIKPNSNLIFSKQLAIDD